MLNSENNVMCFSRGIRDVEIKKFNYESSIYIIQSSIDGTCFVHA